MNKISRVHCFFCLLLLIEFAIIMSDDDDDAYVQHIVTILTDVNAATNRVVRRVRRQRWRGGEQRRIPPLPLPTSREYHNVIAIPIDLTIDEETPSTLMQVSKSWVDFGLQLQAYPFQKQTPSPSPSPDCEGGEEGWRCLICLEAHHPKHYSFIECKTCNARVCESSIFRLAFATMCNEDQQLKTACIKCPQCRNEFKIKDAL
jgi:hypothetical protein